MQDSIPYQKKQYVMFDFDKKTEDISYWDNVISCSNELCNYIENLDEISSSYVRIPKWSDWTASNDNSIHYGFVKNIMTDSFKEQCADDLTNKRTLYIKNTLLMAVEMCFNLYMQNHRLDKNQYFLDTRILPIKKWDVGQSMGPHCDNYDGHSNLAFSMVTYLNDSYSGGEIFFPNQDVKIKPKAGSLIMFPSHEPFVHQVLPITSGTRYMMSTSVFKK